MLLCFILQEKGIIATNFWALKPLSLNGLKGIVSTPLLHGSWDHLFSNMLPLLVLGTAMFYFYGSIAKSLIFWLYLLTHISLWIMGRTTYHIGASGLVYSFAFFLMLSGFIRRSKSLKALSFVVIFLYGSLVWGIFPLNPEHSWEGHLAGLISGITLALVYRKDGPMNDPKPNYDDEEDDAEGDGPKYWEIEDEGLTADAKPLSVVYRYKKNALE